MELGDGEKQEKQSPKEFYGRGLCFWGYSKIGRLVSRFKKAVGFRQREGRGIEKFTLSVLGHINWP